MSDARTDLLERLRTLSEWREVKGLGKVALRQFSSNEMDAYTQMRRDPEKRRESVPWLIKRCVLDKPHGSPVFTDEDLAALGQSSGVLLDRLLGEIIRFAEADAEAIARAGESLAETRASDSVSDSPSLSASPSDG